MQKEISHNEAKAYLFSSFVMLTDADEAKERLTQFLKKHEDAAILTAHMLSHCNNSQEALDSIIERFMDVPDEKICLIFDIVISSEIICYEAKHLIPLSEAALKTVQSLNSVNKHIGKHILEVVKNPERNHLAHEDRVRILSDKLVKREDVVRELLITDEYYHLQIAEQIINIPDDFSHISNRTIRKIVEPAKKTRSYYDPKNTLEWCAAHPEQKLNDEVLVAATKSSDQKRFLDTFIKLPKEYQAHLTKYPHYRQAVANAVRLGIPIDMFQRYASHDHADHNLPQAVLMLNKLIAKEVDQKIVFYLIALAVLESRQPCYISG